MSDAFFKFTVTPGMVPGDLIKAAQPWHAHGDPSLASQGQFGLRCVTASCERRASRRYRREATE